MFHYLLCSNHVRAGAVTSVLVLSTFALPNAGAQAVGSVQQDRQATLHVSHARTPVPPVVYRSVFADLPQGVEATALDWKAANAKVGQFKRGHIDVLKWEQEQAAKAPPLPAQNAQAPKLLALLQTHNGWTRPRLGGLIAMAAALLTSNITWALPPDGGTSRLQAQITGKVIGVQAAPVALPQPSIDSRETIAHLLGAPLTLDAAVRIALLNNPDLQTTLSRAAMGITDWQDADNLAKRQAQVDITVLSTRATQAWVQAVAAAQSEGHLREAKATAEAAGELARRMVQAGNMSKLNQAMHQARLSEAVIALARAQQDAFTAREQLIQLLGLWGAQTQFTLVDTLPALPSAALELPDIEAQAMAARGDVAALTAQWQLKRKPPAAPGDLWDAMGDAAAVRAAAVKVRSQARLAYFNYRSSLDIAQQLQTQVLPLRKFISDELTLRYNGMLTSVFDVLADSQTQSLAVNAATLATRDFWLAYTALQALLAGAPLETLSKSGSTSNSTGPDANGAAPGNSPAGH